VRRSAEGDGRSLERRAPDQVSLAAGVGIVVLGVALLLDQVDAIELSFGWLGAIVAAVAGTALMISGLRDPGPPPQPPVVRPMVSRSEQ
jgi:peptidoglycan/LPS O-acetylase OafA/YrhL